MDAFDTFLVKAIMGDARAYTAIFNLPVELAGEKERAATGFA